MTNTKLNLTLVGGFVLIATITLIVVLSVLAGRSGATDSYYTVYDSVPGLKFGSKVLFQGYQVGQVDNIAPFEEGGATHFRIELSVAKGWKIPQDSVARSEASGILAPQSIYIAAGTSPTALQPGAMIAPAAGSGLMSNMRDMTQNANILMATVVQELPQMLKQAGKTINDMDRFVNNADQAVGSLTNSAHHLEKFVQTGGPELLATLRELRLTSEAFSRHSESFSQNMDATSSNLQEFSRQIRQNPGLLLRNSDTIDDPGTEKRKGSKR
jgi:phospholipid/cholesterol/gamma-HCH transport system substrate-binding protein